MPDVSARDLVLSALREGALTDEGIERATALSHGKASHARQSLWREGFITQAGKDDRRHGLWQLVPEGDREHARTQHRDVMERRLRNSLDKKPIAQQAAIAFHLLLKDDVDVSFRELFARQRNWRRAQAAANNVRREKEADRRARRKQMRAAANDEALFEFLTMRDRIRGLIDALLVMHHQLEDDRGRVAASEPPRIPLHNWSDVHRNIHEVLVLAQVMLRDLAAVLDVPMDSCPACGARLVHHQEELSGGYIDGEVLEEDEF